MQPGLQNPPVGAPIEAQFGGPQPSGNPKADAAAAKAYAKANRPWFKKKRWWLAGLIVLIVIIAAATSGGGGDTTVAGNGGSVSADDVVAGNEAPAAENSDSGATAAQKNALRAAKNYLAISPFSRQGLIDQLSSSAGDGYSVEDATYAADNVNANWNQQAARAAENYLEMMPFSRDGLIEQLSSQAGDKFTVEQATYGVDKAGL